MPCSLLALFPLCGAHKRRFCTTIRGSKVRTSAASNQAPKASARGSTCDAHLAASN